MLSKHAIEELKSRVKKYHGSLEIFASYIRTELGVSITLNSIHRTISGQQTTNLERYKAIAVGLKFSSIEEAFPTNPNYKKHGKKR